MTTPFSRAIAQTQRSLRSLAGETVTYYPLEGAVIENVTGRRGDSQTAFMDEQGFQVQSRSIDWLIAAEDLIGEDDYPRKPVRGDTFVDADGKRWMVIDLGPTEPPARYSDPDGREWRIHTKQVPT